MASTLTGDYKNFPEAIRELLPQVCGEFMDLKTYLEIHHELFMDKKSKCLFLQNMLGPFLGLFQQLIEEKIIVQICKLTDEDKRGNEHLSLWSLLRIKNIGHSPDFEKFVMKARILILKRVESIRQNRNKIIVHNDMDTSIGKRLLPKFLYQDLYLVADEMEEYINYFFYEFDKTTLITNTGYFDFVTNIYNISQKAKVYDELENRKLVEENYWKSKQYF